MLDFVERIAVTEHVQQPSAGALRFKRHYHSGAYKRPTSSRGGVKATLLELPLCAVDGEGKTRPNGSHDYTLLAATTDGGFKHKIESTALTTEQCFEFLLDLPEHHTYVIFGGSYDTNMMLKMLPLKAIDRLLNTGRLLWKNYRIRWVERKYFTLHGSRGRRITLYDVLANWQTTFVKACQDWEVGTKVELDLVIRMKEQRGNFDDVDDVSILGYCFLECDLLRDLCRKLFSAILATPYRPNAVYGPGALASAALKKHGVKRYMAELPEQIEFLTHYAYFGGRFDCSMFGWFSDVWQYDIKSAYPDQIRYLPCLAHGEWRKVSYESFLQNGVPQWGMVQVEWDVGEDVIWPPFPHRDNKGNVFYPYKGRGWYHTAEVTAAMELYPGSITFVTGWELVTNCGHKPFDFVDSLFEIRKTMPYAQGIVFKLILNSLYGKLAQQVGSENERKPPFQCFYWAGAITSGTRAKLLRALAQSPESIIGIATDSLVSLRELDIDLGSNLGQWDDKQLDTYAQISNGVYRAVDKDGKEIERSRGFGRATVDWDALRDDYIRTRGTGQHTFTAKSRFITLRESRNRLDRQQVACTWTQGADTERTLAFFPARRFPGEYFKDGPRVRLDAYEPFGAFESQPFKLKAASQDVIDARAKFNPYHWQDF